MAMIIERTNISLTRGDTGALEVNIFDENGDPKDFQIGDIVYMTVKEKPVDTAIIFQKVLTEFDGNSVLIPIDPVDTEGLPFGTYAYDVQWSRSNGDVHTIVRPSNFIVASEVTYD